MVLIGATGLSGLISQAIESEGLALDQRRARYLSPNISGFAGHTASAATTQPGTATGEAALGLARGWSASPFRSAGPCFASY